MPIARRPARWRARAARRRTAVLALLATAALAAGCTGGDPDGPEPEPTASSSAATPARQVRLTLGLWGSDPELLAYRAVVDAYESAHPGTRVKIVSFADHDELRAALDAGQVPDVFMVARGDLPDLSARRINQPIGDLLDERDVDFGDGYSRPALEAFASDRDLQCMPYGVSPMVVYYNTEQVDFAAMARRGLAVPPIDDPAYDANPGWTFEQFTAAAEYAARPRRGIAGFSVAPTLRGLAPFVYSGGGRIFDDDDTPTSLAFSSDDTRSALEEVLPLLRDPKVGLSADQLAAKTPLEWFKEGRLAMIAGFRSLTPELRAVSGLSFDVMPMPVVEDPATIGELTGVCISRTTPEVAAAADFLVEFIGAQDVSAVSGAGYLVPANVAVALSDAFVQTGQQPAHSVVFTNSIRSMRIPPLLGTYADLEAAVAAPLEDLLTVDVLDQDQLTQLTQDIDEASLPVLAPPPDDSSVG